MRLLICIDDTDSQTSVKGTGAIADDIRNMISTYFDVTCSFVSRHQLLIHPDVPYTSHNSSMCFGVIIPDEKYEELKEKAAEILASESDPESDPGLAIADIDTVDAEKLIAYGKECKRRLMTKADAYAIAEEAGFFLNEYGGTGDGIIGAAAGIGLRLWGQDGTMKGKPKDLKAEQRYTVEELLQSLYISRVIEPDGTPAPNGLVVDLPKKPKVTVIDGALTMMIEPSEQEGIWQPVDREIAKHYGDRMVFREGCEQFKPDVEEEQTGEGGCYDCLYRRWTEKGILCQKPQEDA